MSNEGIGLIKRDSSNQDGEILAPKMASSVIEQFKNSSNRPTVLPHM